MIRAFLFLSLCSSMFCPAAEPGPWTPIFNGKNFDGWVNVNCAPQTWSVREGMIHCTGLPTGELRTTSMHENFELELEWRHLRARGNAGVFVWADALPAMGQPFIRGIEVQVLENSYGNTKSHSTHGDIFPIHGAKMTPVNGRGGSRAFPTEERSKATPEWNHYRVVCNNGDISLAVNGKVVTQGRAGSPRKGYLCLESEGSPVEFRNLRLRELPTTNPKPEEVATADEGFKSLYTGVDLAGWKSETAAKWKSADWTLVCDGKEAKPLSNDREFGDATFILDWRQADGKSADKRVPLTLGGVRVPGETDKPAGQWNRAMITRKGERATVVINGKTVTENAAELPPRARVSLVAEAGAVHFANLFVKEAN